MPQLETPEEKRTYKTGRLRQLLGLNGSELDDDQTDALGNLADLAADSATNDGLDQPLSVISQAQLARAREIVQALPQTTATEHWLHVTEFGPYPYVGV